VALAVYMVLVAMFLVGAASPIEAGSGNSAAYVSDQVIVRFADGVDPQAQADINSRNGGQEVNDLGGIRAKVMRVASGGVERAVRAYRADSRVLYAEPNYIVHAISPIRGPLATIPGDPSFGQLWGLRNTGQTLTCPGGCYGSATGTAGADIKAEPAWSVTTGNGTVVVGVVDTGIDYNHPDLTANAWSNPGGIGGCAAGTHGYNAITKTCNPLDDNDHGSHVSGTIGAAGNNGVGVVGVNWNVKIMGLKFLDASGSGSTADAITAIDFAVNAKIAGINIRVLSNSWGGGGFSQALLDAINRANANDILFVAAAGNSASNNDVTPNYPSNYNAPNVVAVAATTNTDGLASFSSYGATTVDLGAPGQDVLSTTRNNTYSYFSGTSMATPHVSGAAALVVSQTPTMNVATLKSTLLSSVDPLPSLSGRTVSGGRLNLCKAIVGCGGPPPAPDYSLSVSPASATVTQGASASYTVNIARTGGFTGAVSFTISGLPAGAAGSFSPNPSSINSSALTVTTSATTPTGSYVFTVTGTSGTLSHVATATLVVQPPAAPNFTLSATPTSRTINQGASTTYAITITRSGGFTGSVTFSVSGLGTGQTGTYSPNPATANTSTLTVTTTATAATGSRVLTITGTSGTLSSTTTVTLVVNATCTDGNCQN
jgi:subtilisin family serine protease